MLVRNTGLVTLTDFAVELTPKGRLASSLPKGSFRFLSGRAFTTQPKVFPRQTVQFPAQEFSFELDEGTMLEPGDAVLGWMIYLDNSPPGVGELDLYGAFATNSPSPP